MYCRDRGLISLPQAIHKMTLMPANRIESAGCKAMKRKGRLQAGIPPPLHIHLLAVYI